MKFEINRARNGWVLKHENEDVPDEMVVGVETEDEFECFRAFLRAIDEHYGPSNGKYSQKRIRMFCLPGNSYEGKLDSEQKEELRDLYEELKSIAQQFKLKIK